MKKYKCVYTDTKGRIFFKVTLGKDPITHKMIQKKSYTNEFGKSFKTLEEAYATMLAVKSDFIKNHDNHTDESQPFSSYIDDVYAPYYGKTVQESTEYNAKSHFRLMNGFFKNKQMNRITPIDCSNFRMHLLEKFPGKDPRPLASNYAGAVWVRFKAALTHAYEMKIIRENPAANISTPSKEHQKTPFWTFAEFKTAIQSFDLSDFHQQWHATVIWLYYFSGLRVNEATALKWADIDFEKAELYINKTFSQNKDGKKVLHEHTKTRTGMRTVDLDAQTVDVLRRWQRVQPNSSSAGYVIGQSGTVSISTSTVSRLLKSVCKKTGLPIISGKSLRKSHVSYLINELEETNTKYLQQRMGHKKIITTLDYYAEFDENIAVRNKKRKKMEKQLEQAGLQLFPEIKSEAKSTKKSTKLKLIS